MDVGMIVEPHKIVPTCVIDLLREIVDRRFSATYPNEWYRRERSNLNNIAHL